MRKGFVLFLGLAGAAAFGATPREELVALRAKLATDGQLGRVQGRAAEQKFATTCQDPLLAAEVLYDVGQAQRREDSAKAAIVFEKILQAYPKAQPWASLASFELARLYGGRGTTRPKAMELFEAYLKTEGAETARQAEALLALASYYQEGSKPQEAIDRYRAFVEKFPDRASLCAEAWAAIGKLYIDLKQPKAAYEAFLKLSVDYPWELERRRDLLLAVTQAYRTTEDPEGAIAAYEKLLDDLPRTDPRRIQAYNGLAMVQLQQKNTAAATEVYSRMAADKAISPSYRASAFRQLFTLSRQANDYGAIARYAYQFIASQPSRVLEAGNLLGDLVDALVQAGRIDEALGMAKAHYRLTCMATGYGNEAVLSVVRALKAKEGSLRTAQAFITFVEQGPDGLDDKPGTADDLADPTAAYRLPPEPERDRVFAEAAKRFGNDPLELGYLYVCWDKPPEALAAFRRNYLEGFETTRLQAAIALLTKAMRAFGCPEKDIDAFFAYQNFGPNGEDGKPNTKDDLKDPIFGKK